MTAGTVPRLFGLAFRVRLLFLEDTRMMCTRRMKKTNAEVSLPFIGNIFAASIRRETSLYSDTPGFSHAGNLHG